MSRAPCLLVHGQPENSRLGVVPGDKMLERVGPFQRTFSLLYSCSAFKEAYVMAKGSWAGSLLPSVEGLQGGGPLTGRSRERSCRNHPRKALCGFV